MDWHFKTEMYRMCNLTFTSVLHKRKIDLTYCSWYLGNRRALSPGKPQNSLLNFFFFFHFSSCLISLYIVLTSGQYIILQCSYQAWKAFRCSHTRKTEGEILNVC